MIKSLNDQGQEINLVTDLLVMIGTVDLHADQSLQHDALVLQVIESVGMKDPLQTIGNEHLILKEIGL